MAAKRLQALLAAVATAVRITPDGGGDGGRCIACGRRRASRRRSPKASGLAGAPGVAEPLGCRTPAMSLTPLWDRMSPWRIPAPWGSVHRRVGAHGGFPEVVASPEPVG